MQPWQQFSRVPDVGAVPGASPLRNHMFHQVKHPGTTYVLRLNRLILEPHIYREIGRRVDHLNTLQMRGLCALFHV